VLFLHEVLGMERSRIEAIRKIADQIADHIEGDNDRRLLRAINVSRRYGDLRASLIRSSLRLVKQGHAPLTKLIDFIDAFEPIADDTSWNDWSLVRDLIMIRVIEQLHERRWFTPDVIDEISSDEDDEHDAAVR
jgi:CRISPR-associated protein Cst1